MIATCSIWDSLARVRELHSPVSWSVIPFPVVRARIRLGLDAGAGSTATTGCRHQMTFSGKIVSLLMTFGLVSFGCSADREAAKKRIAPEYDTDGKLHLLKYDSKGTGRVDTWSYMDGARVVRIEIDSDDNGSIDRWEYYGADQQLERIGLSKSKDGRVDRVEYYDQDVLVRAEEDTDADGRLDKWETYEAARLASVAFDTLHRGVPDRRLTYGASGTARMELDLAGDGHLLPTTAAARKARPIPLPIDAPTVTSAFQKE